MIWLRNYKYINKKTFMINLTILTSENNFIVENIIQYFQNYADAKISGVISNIDNNNIDKRLRRYKIPIKYTTQYKEMDKFLQETKSHYILIVDYNEKIPPNFCKKYIWRMYNFKKTEKGIIVYHEKELFDNQDIIFIKNIDNVEELSLDEINDEINNLAIRFYPSLIENIIREIHKKIYK